MFIYSNGNRWNVLVPLDELEAANVLLSDPSTLLDAKREKRHAAAEVVAKAMRTGGKIHLLIRPLDGDARLVGFRDTLDALADPYRRRAIDALDAVAKRFATRYDAKQIDCIADVSANAPSPTPPKTTSS